MKKNPARIKKNPGTTWFFNLPTFSQGAGSGAVFTNTQSMGNSSQIANQRAIYHRHANHIRECKRTSPTNRFIEAKKSEWLIIRSGIILPQTCKKNRNSFLSLAWLEGN